MTRLTRRHFLSAALLGAAGVGCNVRKPHEGFWGAMERWNDGVQRGLFSRSRLAREEPASAITNADDFPAYHVAPAIPEATEAWVLEVKGLCARPRLFSVPDLQQLPRTDFRVRHHCVEGWSAVASWHGVRVSEIARVCGADPRARFIEFRSFDQGPDDPRPYYSSWDIESAAHPQTILAYGMNGELLEPAHGAPVRLYSGVKLGYKMVKYLTEVIFLPERTGGYWEDRGYEWFAGV
jgi:DMSO/TMAO reductase YedYZ molybdopterin-dependent catalytic subunit